MSTIKKAPNETKGGVTANAVKQGKDKVMDALLTTLSDAKANDSGNLIFYAHTDLLPSLFEGWISSESCAALAPHLRAAIFNQYVALHSLLMDLDEILDRLPSITNSK